MFEAPQPRLLTTLQRAYCLLARQELGLETYDIKTTIRDTVDSYYRLGLID